MKRTTTNAFIRRSLYISLIFAMISLVAMIDTYLIFENSFDGITEFFIALIGFVITVMVALIITIYELIKKIRKVPLKKYERFNAMIIILIPICIVVLFPLVTFISERID